MRIIRFLIGLLVVMIGLAIGVSNPQSIAIDLGLMMVPVTIGILIVMSMVLGVVLGRLMLPVAVVWPLRQQLRHSCGAPVVVPIGSPENSGA